MDEQTDERAQTFPVVCAWCGSEIRRGSTPESSGMCRSCFQQMVEEHTRLAAQQQQTLAHASDR